MLTEKYYCLIIIKPNDPGVSVVVDFIEDNGAPIELMQIGRSIADDGI